MKTSIQFRLRPSVKTPEMGTVIIQVTRRRVTNTLTTGLRTKVSEWERCKHSARLNKIRKKLERERRLLEQQGDFTARQLLDRYKGQERYSTLTGYANKRIAELKSSANFENARCYRSSLNSFMRFRKGLDIPLNKMDASLMAAYEKYLRQSGKKPNTTSHYLRTLRAIYNSAVAEHIIDRPAKNPFEMVFTGNAPTDKRSVSKRVIAQVHALALPENSGLCMSRDLFMFSFFAQGMSYIDMVHLKRSNICGGYIRYKRHKTGQAIQIKMLPCIHEILSRYAVPKQRPNDYLFPILKSADDAALQWRSYTNGLAQYNRDLKRITTLLKLEEKLTGYVARHSWATQAAREGIPIATISRGMGHELEKTTRIYISKLDYSDVNRANRKILAFLGDANVSPVNSS